MSQKDNQLLFFNHIKQIFLQNPNLDINHNTIYSELSLFNNENKIDMESLVSLQVSIANKYRNNNKINTFSNDYYLVIENREGLNDVNYYKEIENSIKLYVAVDYLCIKKVATKIIDFINKESIISQLKITRNIRNDAFVIRVGKKEDIKKIISFINNINYTSTIKINPFINSIKNIGMTMDGKLQYNKIISNLLEDYFNKKKIENDIENASLDGFATYIKEQLIIIKNKQYLIIPKNIVIKDSNALKDYKIILEIIIKNIEGNISDDFIYNKQLERLQYKEQIEELNNDKNYLLYIMNELVSRYGVKEAHERVMKYINKEANYNIFPRENNIRSIVIENYKPKIIKSELSELGYKSLLDSIDLTIKKHDVNQAKYAIKRLINNGNIDAFTNDNDIRSYMGFIIPKELLKEVIIEKTNAKDTNYSIDVIVNLLIEEAQKESELRGRN